MPSRLELQTQLENLLGSRNVYFQPPESLRMKYPAIVYTRDGINNTFAGDEPYVSRRRYSVTVIDEDPDSLIIDKINTLKNCQFNRHFTSDQLHHDVFTLFY